MTKVLSRLTKKYQATVPKTVRDTLDLHSGDSLVFEVTKKKQVTLRKAHSVDLEFAQALVPTLSEWVSENDENAYHDL